MKTDLATLIRNIPEGATFGSRQGRRHLVTKTTFNNNRSCKIYGEELGGSDFVSLNYYETSSGGICKPCEMSQEKVLRFLEEFIPETN